MIIIVERTTQKVKLTTYNSSDISVYSDCMYINGEKIYSLGEDNTIMYRVEQLPNDLEECEYYYNGRKFYKKSRVTVTRGMRT